MPLYQFSYIIECEIDRTNYNNNLSIPKKNKNNYNKLRKIFVTKTESLEDATTFIEQHIKKRVLFTGELRSYNITLLKVIHDVEA